MTVIYLARVLQPWHYEPVETDFSLSQGVILRTVVFIEYVSGLSSSIPDTYPLDASSISTPSVSGVANVPRAAKSPSVENHQSMYSLYVRLC